jgi:hypothetical protein
MDTVSETNQDCSQEEVRPNDHVKMESNQEQVRPNDHVKIKVEIIEENEGTNWNLTKISLKVKMKQKNWMRNYLS